MLRDSFATLPTELRRLVVYRLVYYSGYLAMQNALINYLFFFFFFFFLGGGGERKILHSE